MFKRLGALLLALALLLAAGAACAERYDLTGRKRVAGKAVAALVEELSALPPGTDVDLTGVSIKLDDQLTLLSALPTLHFIWRVAFADVKVDGDTETLDLDALTKKRLGVVTLRKALLALPKVKRVVMFKQALKVAEMEALMAEHPDVVFDWSVRIDPYLIRIDTTAFSTLKGRQKPRYTADALAALRYCTQLLALDFGHNDVSDLRFLTNWPHLKALIIVDSKTPIRDLSPLSELSELEYVELFMQDITDISALANKPRLLDLNLCHNNVTDLSPLYGNTAMERLWISYNPSLTDDEIAAFQRAVPGCVVERDSYQSTGAGWRSHERYAVIQKMFESRAYIPFAGGADEAREGEQP